MYSEYDEQLQFVLYGLWTIRYYCTTSTKIVQYGVHGIENIGMSVLLIHIDVVSWLGSLPKVVF